MLSRAWSGLTLRGRKSCRSHSLLGPCYLAHLRKRQHIRRGLWPGCSYNSCYNLVILTADNKVHRIAGAVTDRIEDMTPEGSLVIAGHTDDDEGGSFISGLNSVTDGDLRAAVEPGVGERGAGRDATPQDG